MTARPRDYVDAADLVLAYLAEKGLSSTWDNVESILSTHPEFQGWTFLERMQAENLVSRQAWTSWDDLYSMFIEDPDNPFLRRFFGEIAARRRAVVKAVRGDADHPECSLDESARTELLQYAGRRVDEPEESSAESADKVDYNLQNIFTAFEFAPDPYHDYPDPMAVTMVAELLDREWFQRNPNRRYRIRPLYCSFRWDGDGTANCGLHYFDVVHRDVNGAVKRRRYVRGGGEAPIPPNNERTAQLLWELPTSSEFYR